MSPDDSGRGAGETITHTLTTQIPFCRRVTRLLAVSVLLILSACTNGNGDTLNDLTIVITDTPGLIPTVANSIIASPTVDPALIVQSPIPSGNLGADSFVPGDVPTAASASQVVTITPTPVATQPSIALYIPSKTLTLVGRYYGLAPHPAGAALLIPGVGETKEDWGTLPIRLNEIGYNVLAFDQRGTGETGGTLDWSQTPDDVSTVLGYMHNLPNIDPRRSIAIGSGVGGILAIKVCAADAACQSAIVISPRQTDQGLSLADALQKFGQRNLLIVSTASSVHSADAAALEKAVTGAHQTIRYAGGSEGLTLFTEHPDLAGSIANWLTQIALSTSKSH